VKRASSAAGSLPEGIISAPRWVRGNAAQPSTNRRIRVGSLPRSEKAYIEKASKGHTIREYKCPIRSLKV
jgi:hypothetical protein